MNESVRELNFEIEDGSIIEEKICSRKHEPMFGSYLALKKDSS